MTLVSEGVYELQTDKFNKEINNVALPIRN